MTETNSRHMTWDALQQILFVEGEERQLPIKWNDSPDLTLRTRGNDTFGLLMPCNEARKTISELKKLENIRAEAVDFQKQLHIYYSTSNKGLAKTFYGMLIEIADLIQVHNESPQKAIRTVAKDFGNLILEKKILSKEKQIGLYGELLTLKQLIKSHGDKAIKYWTGPTRDPHDFRFGKTEIEVKTTIQKTRVHTVRLGQMEPSPDHVLYLHSIHLASSENGKSLVNIIDHIRRTIKTTKASEDFEKGLVENSYSNADEDSYTSKYVMRTYARLIEVEENFPAITRALISAIPNSFRIEDVWYQINVDNLGFSKTDKKYLNIFPTESVNVNA